MVVERSRRLCLLCGTEFDGRTFLCRPCADRYRHGPLPTHIRRQFYEAVDRVHPAWSNTFGQHNPPRELLRQLECRPRTDRVLEIGAGGGYVLQRLRDLGFRDPIGLDLASTTLAAMRARLPDLPLVAADAERLPFADQSFDVLLSSDVVEHLPDLERHLAEAARVLRPGGVYLFKTPNRLVAETYYRLSGLYDAYFWHPSMRSPGELRDTLARHHFTCQFLSPDRLTQAQLRKIPVKPARRLAVKVPIGWLPPAARPHLEVVATRHPDSID